MIGTRGRRCGGFEEIAISNSLRKAVAYLWGGGEGARAFFFYANKVIRIKFSCIQSFVVDLGIGSFERK